MGSLKKTIVIKLNPEAPAEEAISRAAEIIRKGGLVAFPTETVYGIAANFSDAKAVDKLYEVKARPRNKPFTVHISDARMMRDMGCAIDGRTARIIKKFWPGPLTILLKSDTGGKIGFRMPANKIALLLIKEAGVPVIAPSANLSGNRAPDTGAEVLRQLDGRIDMLLDAGPTEVGVESTVLDLTVTPPEILREGAIKKEELLKKYE